MALPLERRSLENLQSLPEMRSEILLHSRRGAYSLDDTGETEMSRVVAVLESMWDWRQMTSGAGYEEAPRWFRINPQNYSGKRLYRIVGPECDLRVTNACRKLCSHANDHGTPDPKWLRENLEILEPFSVLLVCGAVAQATYRETGYEHPCVIETMHPAARRWTNALIEQIAQRVRSECEFS